MKWKAPSNASNADNFGFNLKGLMMLRDQSPWGVRRSQKAMGESSGRLAMPAVRPCRLNPKLSAFEALEGAFHFTSTPFAPPGAKTLAYENPGRRASWGFHAHKGWYIGPALNHHQCYRYITQSTGAERITDIIKFQHHNVKVP